MPISTILSYFTSNSAFKKLSQEQNEALVRLLAYAQAIDGHVDAGEQKILVRAVRDLRWQGAHSLEDFVARAIADAGSLVGNRERKQAFVRDVAAGLGEDWLREEAYYMAAKMTLSDRDLQEVEQAFLREIVEAFAIRPERLEVITGLLIRDNAF